MFTRLERYVFAALVTLALWAAVPVAVPAVAQAQEKAPNNKTNTQVAEQRVVVVDPGDTLWSISTEELRPNAAPGRVARGVERIYALNRDQIGPDSSLIFPGQRLLVPSSGSEPSASRRSADSEPPARKAAEAASAGGQAGRQAKHGTLGAPRQTAAEVRGEDRMAPEAASKRAPLPEAARAAPVPAVRQNTAEEPTRLPGEAFVDKARTAVANVTSALGKSFTSGEGYEDHTWRELLGAALLAVSAVSLVLAFVLTFALLLAPERTRRSLQEAWWREVYAKARAYERASFNSSPDDALENGTTGAHAHVNGNGAYANGKAPLGMIHATERKRGRLRRRGRPRTHTRHVSRGLAHGAYGPRIRHLLRRAPGTRSGTRPRRPASHGRLTAAPSPTGVRGR